MASGDNASITHSVTSVNGGVAGLVQCFASNGKQALHVRVQDDSDHES